MNLEITKNFKTREFKCPCCGKIKYDKALVDRLQIIRNIIGIPITITSGYRCQAFNTKIKGYEKSLHMEGIAVDIVVRKDKLKELNTLCKQVFYNTGVGTYSNHTHVDLGKYQRFNGVYN